MASSEHLSDNSESSEGSPYDCTGHQHLFDQQEVYDYHWRPEEETWFACDSPCCPNRYTTFDHPPVQASWGGLPVASWQEDLDFTNAFSEASVPPGPEHVTRLPSPSNTNYSPSISNRSSSKLEDLLNLVVLESEEYQEFILLTTTIGDVKPDTIPVLAQASQYANWSAAMRGYLMLIEAWPAISSGDITADGYSKMNSRAQGVLLMRTDRNIHHHLLETDGETLKSSKAI